MTRKFQIAVLAGDGIGPEVTEPCLNVLGQACAGASDFDLEFQHISAGAGHYKKTGVSLSKEALSVARNADAILLAAMGLPEIRYANGTEIAPQLELREALNLYAGVRPIRTIKGIPHTLADRRADGLDFVLIRESTEGLFASRGRTVITDDAIANDTMVITRSVCEKLFDFSLALGRKRKADGFAGRVTCVDKANVLGAFAFFRKIFDERAASFQDVHADHAYVDATGHNLIKRPWEFDVLVTENMFGDILSDVGAALMGGMGFAPSADIGDDYAVFQPCHGSAPDIAGAGKANPTAMFLSAAMMLDWLGDKHNCAQACIAASRINRAVDRAFDRSGILPYELGGNAGTRDITDAVLAVLNAVPEQTATV